MGYGQCCVLREAEELGVRWGRKVKAPTVLDAQSPKVRWEKQYIMLLCLVTQDFN